MDKQALARFVMVFVLFRNKQKSLAVDKVALR